MTVRKEFTEQFCPNRIEILFNIINLLEMSFLDIQTNFEITKCIFCIFENIKDGDVISKTTFNDLFVETL